MQLFYNPALDNSYKQFFFSPEESKHIVRVLRKKEKDLVYITNGRGYLFEAEILVADQKKCKAQIVSVEKTVPKRYKLHMVVAPTKMNDRYEWFLEKVTEIGVDEITPILCEQSERKVVKLDRMNRIVQSAMKQSLQTSLPKLNPMISFQDFLKQENPGLKFIAHCDNGERVELKRRAAADKDITILIGPEGDFSKAEIESAKALGYVPISLGKTRLRTETAGIVACSTITMINS